MTRSAQEILDKIQDVFNRIDLEEDETIKNKYYKALRSLRDDVKALDQENKNFFDKMVHTVFRKKYEKHYKKLMEIWREYERESQDAANQRNGGTSSNTEHRRATESSPSLGLPPQQQLQGYGSQTASRSTAAVHNVPRNPNTWRSRMFTHRDPTGASSSSAPGINMASSAERQQAPVPGRTWGGNQSQHGAPTRDGQHQFALPNTPGPNVMPWAEQHQTHLPGNNWGGQQYRQPQHGVPTRDARTHQFAPPNAPGLSMAPSSEQHRAYVPEHIMTYEEMQHVERQVNEDWMRPSVAAQGPGMGQYHQPNVLPQGQYSLPPPPRPVQYQSASVQHEVQAQGSINAHAGPSHTRSQTATSRNTFGHGLPGQPGIGEPGPSQYYDHRGDSLDSNGNTVPRTSYSSEGSYHYRY
ncbi:hypothetical protein PILCRDRAFT_814266 [Piloderma croceum F 1598]|uniref:Uncharacterized protein n=1 Tax=Piloderma croceum (strain F 1598) TaxID=765440 RepID=A0A0C3BPE7_PILCF|nr:hypothetical protein PILCRDRAFT_814266 [Piloderma croceum F 1598]